LLTRAHQPDTEKDETSQNGPDNKGQDSKTARWGEVLIILFVDYLIHTLVIGEKIGGAIEIAGRAAQKLHYERYSPN
jgi:hypothetical protein